MRKVVALFTLLVLTLNLCACSKKVEKPTWQEQYNLGVRYLSDGDYEEAIIAFNAAIEIDPMQAEAYLNLANAYIGMNNFDAARDILQRGYELTQSEELIAKLEELDSGNVFDFWGNMRKQSGYDEEGKLLWYQIFGFERKHIISVTTYNALGIQTGYWDGYRYNERGELVCAPSYTNDDGIVIGYDEFVEFDKAGNCVRSNYCDLDGRLKAYHISIYDQADHCIRGETYQSDGTLSGINEFIYEGDRLASVYIYNISTGQKLLSGHTEYRYNEDDELISMINYNENGEIVGEQTWDR